MELDKQVCSICQEKFGSLERVITENKDILTFVIEMNCQLQDRGICHMCLSKIQDAYKFKMFYSETSSSQKTSSSIVKEESNSEDCIDCRICKRNISSNKSIPLFSSVPETGLNLLQYFSPELELEICDDFQTCDSCHKSLINFYNVTHSLLISNQYSQDNNYRVNESDYVNVKEESQQPEDGCSTDYFFKTNTKDELYDSLRDIKIEEDILKIEDEEESVEIEEQQIDKKDIISTNYVNQRTHEADMFKCHICVYETKWKSTLKKHMLKHKNPDEVQMFKCNNCEFETKRKYYLKTHMLRHKNSNEVDMFKCNNCEFETKRKSTLKTHMLRHKNSNEVDMFKCNYCQYEAKHKDGLNKHMLKHKNSDEVEMFKCNYCQYETKYKSTFKKHLLKHKNSDEVEMFKCNYCKFETKYKYHLKKHMFKHKNVYCARIILDEQSRQYIFQYQKKNNTC